ncbi:MAG: hypothetical protein BGO25_09330 [Acidobacteriales bacterium 59-55]|nr:MAG: hypothetical protein BGO25_09330 [Acidobacteriales bacterium 59-55]
MRVKLLDLTGRNRLINFKHTPGRSLQFVEGQPTDVYQRLVEANNNLTISILGLPEPSERDWIEQNGRLQRPDLKEWAKAQGIPTSFEMPVTGGARGGAHLRALMYPDDLAKHCRKIEREAASAIEETGANMLFLVLGFLEFPDQRDSDRSYQAPLISIPVSFRKWLVAGIQQFSLQFTGDDISENLSLREKLRNDYGLAVPELDEDQIDVEGYFNAIQSVIENKPGFSIKRRVSLCLLSFNNMLLVRDLDPAKWPQDGDANGLVDHPIVREVFQGSSDETRSGLSLSEDHPVEEGPGAEIPLVYDADSSQHSALVDAIALKKNLVIEGPPGTGKSQTITNLIAASLANGKKVLFVAEKLAALQVVQNRLEMAGLDAYVLELHSNKTSKKWVLEEISKRITHQTTMPSDLHRMQKQLELHRGDLKAYVDLINSAAHNSFGLTLHQVMWRAEKHRSTIASEEAFLSQIVVADATQISEFELNRRIDCLKHLSAQYEIVGGFDEQCTFWGFFPERLIPGDEVHLANTFRSSLEWLPAFNAGADALAGIVGGCVHNLSLDTGLAQIDVLSQVLDTVNRNLPLHLIPGFFADDATGTRAKQAILGFEKQVIAFHAAHSVVTMALGREPVITRGDLEELHALQHAAHGLGVELGALPSLRMLHQEHCEASSKLKTAITAIAAFAGTKNIPFLGTRQKLDQLSSLTTLIFEAPDLNFSLQTPGLTRGGAVPAMERLLALQTEWVELERELNAKLYLDALPPEGDIKQAILTLREGDAWYRFLQSRWRNAVRLHKSIHRSKKRMSGRERLAELEKLIALSGLKEQWQSDSAWAQYLGHAAPSSMPSLTEYVALAKWNQGVTLASEEFEVNVIDLVTFTGDQARALRREFSPLKAHLAAALSVLDSFNTTFPRLNEHAQAHSVQMVLDNVDRFIEALGAQLDWLKGVSHNHARYDEVAVSCEAALERAELKSAIDENSTVRTLLGDLYAGVNTNCAPAVEALEFGQSIDSLNVSTQIKTVLRTNPPLETCESIKRALDAICAGLKQTQSLSDELGRFGSIDVSAWVGKSSIDDLQVFTGALTLALKNALDDIDALIPWTHYLARRTEARDCGLTEFMELLERKRLKSTELADAYAYCVYSTAIREAFRHIPQLGRFTGLQHNQIREEFKRLDKQIIGLRGKAIAYECGRATVPLNGRNGARVDDKTEMVLLNYLMPQQRPRMTVRKMMMRAGKSIQALKPCFMMGPQAVAQYLTPGAITFDVVIMDEASQLKPEEAIGAVARGGQLVVVGDPKQLPPTSFFSRMTQAGDDEEQFSTTDAESILDVCSSHFKPTRSLRWHYRSQHHSLIAFSNHHFYRNLVIFPSPYGQGGKLGVRAVYLADAIYENQTNFREAKRVVDAVVEHIANRPSESLGVVTLNIKQRDLIAELLEERLASIRGADEYKKHWTTEGQPLFVKNLENVQGDERDAIIISTTFGKPVGSSAVRQNFGPISRQGGWRRLNVLFTRAKKSIAIYTSLRPEDIVLDGTTPEGTKVLRHYLEYARTGSLSVTEESGREPDSDFEISVMELLRLKNYAVTPQLGVAGYRIDIAVKHPDAPGSYLAAIECDGATYHSALSVRDRDRIRQEILESLGWRGRIWRIWSTDWFRTPRQESEKLVSFLADLRERWTPEHFAGEAWIEEGQHSQSTPNAVVNDAVITQTEEERSSVISALIDSEDDPAVEVEDFVRYVDIKKPEDVLSVQITNGIDDFANGTVHKLKPLAQALLGAVVGDEVTLHLVGAVPRVFKIIAIEKMKK